jgi:hypothetical protein
MELQLHPHKLGLVFYLFVTDKDTSDFWTDGELEYILQNVADYIPDCIYSDQVPNVIGTVDGLKQLKVQSSVNTNQFTMIQQGFIAYTKSELKVICKVINAELCRYFGSPYLEAYIVYREPASSTTSSSSSDTD